MKLGGVFDTTIFLHIVDKVDDEVGSRVELSSPHTPPSQGEWHFPDPNHGPNPMPLGGSRCFHDEYYLPERSVESVVTNASTNPRVYKITRVKVLVKEFVHCRQVGEYTKEWIESVEEMQSTQMRRLPTYDRDRSRYVQPVEDENSSQPNPDNPRETLKDESEQWWGERNIIVFYKDSKGKTRGQSVLITKDQSGVHYSYPPNTPQEAKDAVESRDRTKGFK